MSGIKKNKGGQQIHFSPLVEVRDHILPFNKQDDKVNII